MKSHGDIGGLLDLAVIKEVLLLAFGDTLRSIMMLDNTDFPLISKDSLPKPS